MNRRLLAWHQVVSVLVALLALAAYANSLEGQFHRRGVVTQCPSPGCNPCDPCQIPPETVFQVSNLTILATGKHFNEIEVYFTASEQDQNVKTDAFPDSRDLHLHNTIAVAPANPAGTFAVRYGPHLDTFRLYAWQKQANDLNVFGPICPEPGYPVCLTFVTARLLKVTYGPENSKTKIYRCIANSNVWEDTAGTTAVTPKPLPK